MTDAIAGFSGRIVTPDDPGYRAVSTIWNQAHDRRPAVIAQCRSTEVVTASGEAVTADADHHPGLYWALRGGTGNFGVVTAFSMRLFPLTDPVAGTLVFPAEEAPAVLRRLREATNGAPDSLNWAAVLTTAPPSPALPGSVRRRPVLLVPLFCPGPEAAARAAPERVRAIGRPVFGTVGPVPFCVFQTATDESAPGRDVVGRPVGVAERARRGGDRPRRRDGVRLAVPAQRVPVPAARRRHRRRTGARYPISASGRTRPGWRARSAPASGTGWRPSSAPATRTGCSGPSRTR